MMIKTCMTAVTLLMISTSAVAVDRDSVLGEVRDRAAGQTTTEGKTALGSAIRAATGTKLNTQPANTGTIGEIVAQNEIDNQTNTNEQPAAGQHSDDSHRGRGRHGDDSHRGHGKHGEDKHSHSRKKKGKHKGHDHDERKNRSRHDDNHHDNHDNKDQSKHEDHHDQDSHD